MSLPASQSPTANAPAATPSSDPQLAAALELCPLGVVLCDSSGLVQYRNAKAIEWTHAPSLSDGASSWNSLGLPWPFERERWSRAMGGHEQSLAPSAWCRPDGYTVMVSARLTTLPRTSNVPPLVACYLDCQELRGLALTAGTSAAWEWHPSHAVFAVDAQWLQERQIDLHVTETSDAAWRRAMHPDDVATRDSALSRVLRGAEHFECEYRVARQDHSWLWVLQRGTVLQRDANGRPTILVGLLVEIDARKQEYFAARENESRLATALWGARAALWQWHAPTDSGSHSPLWYAMTGYTREQWESVPHPWSSRLHPDDRARVEQQLADHAAGRRDSIEYDYRIRTADGRWKWMLDRGRAVEWDLQGKPIVVMGVALDIDAAKSAEQALRASESRLQTVMWGATAGLWELDFRTELTTWCNDWCDRYDIDPCTGVDHVARWDANLHPDDVQEAARRFAAHVAGESDFYEAEYRVRTRAGVWRWVLERGRVVERTPDGAPQRMVGICIDVEDPKLGETNLVAHAARLEAALAASGGGSWDWNLVDDSMHHSDAYYRLLGVEPAAGRAESGFWRRRVHPQDAPERLEQLRRDLRSDCDTHEAEYRIRHEDGGWRWVLDRCRVLERDRTDRPVHIAGLLLDITARKTRELALESSEEALAGSEALFRSAAMLAPGYVWEARFTPGYTARIIRASGGFERVMRCTVEEFERAGSWQGFVADESRVVAFDAMSRLFAGEANLTVELKLRRADDTELWLLVRAQSVRDPVTGQAIGAIGSSEDVTERHRADEALKRSQAQLMTIAASTADWLVLLDASQRVLFLNKPLVGRSPAEIVGRPIGEVAPPGAAEYLRNLVAKVLATGEPVDVEQEYFDPAAGHRVFELRVRAVRSGERVAGAVINATEVTRRREADELRRTQARMLETLREAVAVIQSDGVIRLANPAFERLFEFAPGTAVGHSLVPLLVVPDVDPSMGVERLMSEAMTRTEGAPLEFVCVSCAGAEFTAACVASRMELNDGEHWLIALTDVTERKRMEREILEIASREQLRIGSDLHDGLGQDLTGIALMLRSVSVQLRKEGSKMRAEIDDVIGLVNTAIESTRAMARGLSPVGADRGGLISGLQMMAARGVERYGVRTELTTRLNQPLSIDDATASHLYRIAQEALTNAIRHGHVTQVSVDLYTGDGVLVLTVADNGRGLPVSGRSTDGMGLKLMRYRAQMVQGDLTVTNHPDGGVMVQCTCPHRALEETGPTRSGGFPLKD